MEKVLTTILLVIASLVSAALVINAVYPATSVASGALSSASTQMGDRVKSQTTIVHATGELDQSSTWQDTNSDGNFNIFLWVKNVGTTKIYNVESCDIFVGVDGIWTHVPHENFAGGQFPSWDYIVENGTEWSQSTTIKITISYGSSLTSGEYSIKFILPNGVSDQHSFSM